jgi:membrane protease YdiL (CAAX protease family)
VSQADVLTPVAGAAVALEIAMILCGSWLLWTLALSKKARETPYRRLHEWRLPPMDFACFIAFAFLGATTVSSAAGYLLRSLHLDSDAAMVAGGAVMHLGILVGLGGFFLMCGARARGPAAPVAVPIFRSGLVTFLIAVPLVFTASSAWEYALQKLGLPDEKQDMVDILQNSHSALLKGSLVAVATLLVPITEETIFRAGLFRYFRTRVPRWITIVLTSALFAALHVSWSDNMAGLPSLVPLFVLAVVFCLAYERTGRIGTTIVAHALFNLNTFVLVAAGIGS